MQWVNLKKIKERILSGKNYNYTLYDERILLKVATSKDFEEQTRKDARDTIKIFVSRLNNKGLKMMAEKVLKREYDPEIRKTIDTYKDAFTALKVGVTEDIEDKLSIYLTYYKEKNVVEVPANEELKEYSKMLKKVQTYPIAIPENITKLLNDNISDKFIIDEQLDALKILYGN